MKVSETTKKNLFVGSNKDEVKWLLPKVTELIVQRRGHVNRLYGSHAIVLMSGGLDSSVMAGLLLEKTSIVLHPLFIRRGSRAEKWEEQCYDYFYKYYHQKYPDRFNNGKKIEIQVPPLELKKYKNKEQLSKYGHPMRNVALQTLGIQYAANLSSTLDTDIRTVLTATIPDDSFPHSSLLALRTTTLLTCIESGDWRWNIISPLLDPEILGKTFRKDELISYAITAGIPLEHTRTCIQDSETPCLKCPECLSRIKAFETSGIEYV